jgi:hypothetical protein
MLGAYTVKILWLAPYRYGTTSGMCSLAGTTLWFENRNLYQLPLWKMLTLHACHKLWALGVPIPKHSRSKTLLARALAVLSKTIRVNTTNLKPCGYFTDISFRYIPTP